MNFLKRFSKNEKSHDVGKYGLIKWKRESKKFGVGGRCMKEVRIYRGNNLEDIREYTDSEVNHLENIGIPVIDVTEGLVPGHIPEHVKREIALGVIRE